MDLTALLVLVLLVALTAILWPRYDRRRSLVNKLPGPLALPGFGTSWRLLLTQRRAVFRNFHAMTLRHWPLFRAWTGPYPEVHINKPEHVEKIMSSMDFIEKGRGYDFLHPWLGQGLLTSTGAKWHSHRKMITPAFHFKILDNFVEVFGEKSQILVEKLKQQSGTKVFDIYPYIARCALDIICETAMGTPINAQQNTKSEYVSAVYSISELTIARVLRPWLYNDFIFRLTSTGKQYYKDLDVLHSFTNRVIRERKALRKRNDDPTKNLEQDDLDIGRKKRMAFLDLLLEASDGGTKLSDVEIREEVDTFMFEGHDTTAVGMSWALLLLGHHPEVQEKVYEEMQSIFQGSDRAPTMQDLQEMKYLEMVIKEALRLYPSVPFIARKLLKETDLGGYTIPAGTTAVLHIYHIHRDPDHWTDPERFDPDRFLPDRAQGRHPYAHVPFSGGPRNCIGQKFATLEEKAVLSSIVRNFRVKSQMKREDLDLVGELVLRPLNGVVVQLTPR